MMETEGCFTFLLLLIILLLLITRCFKENQIYLDQEKVSPDLVCGEGLKIARRNTNNLRYVDASL